MCGSSPVQPAAQDPGHGAPLQSPTLRGPIQTCPELAPASPLGAYDGRGKWAAVAVIAGPPARSVTTPSSGDEAQAESNHAITKARIPHHEERLFTKRNLLI